MNISFDRKISSISIGTTKYTGGWFNINMTSYQYRKSHCGDKTILRPSYLHNGIFHTGKMSSLYWIGAHAFCATLTISNNELLDILQFVNEHQPDTKSWNVRYQVSWEQIGFMVKLVARYGHIVSIIYYNATCREYDIKSINKQITVSCISRPDKWKWSTSFAHWLL